MTKENLSKEELIKVVERQEKIIAGYEAVSGLYRKIKNLPLLGRTAQVAAGILKARKLSATKVIENIDSRNPEIIGVCNPHFSRGVRSATYSLSKDVVEVSEIYTLSEAKKVAKLITSHKPQKVLISGYSIGYDLLAQEIKRCSQDIKILVFIHSAFIWFDVYPLENKVFEKFLLLEKEGIIDKLGFCKRDVAEYFKEKGYSSYFVMNRFKLITKEHKINREKIKIGIWGANLWHRNILNQVIGALMVPNVEVHVNEVADHSFLDLKRIVVHGLLPKEEFDKVYPQMDINLYISFTDCFPMTLIESMEEGIPCLASDTSDVYSFDSKLKEKLVVSTIDGPIGIARKIESTLDNYEKIQKDINNYLPVLKEEVEKSIKDFLR